MSTNTNQVLALAVQALSLASTALCPGSPAESDDDALIKSEPTPKRRSKRSKAIKKPFPLQAMPVSTREVLEQKLGHVFENPDLLVCYNSSEHPNR